MQSSDPNAQNLLKCEVFRCRVCAMLLINSGIKRVVAQNKYHAGAESEVMFKKAKIKLEFISSEIVTYKK